MDARRATKNVHAKNRMSKQISINLNYSVSMKVQEENNTRKETVVNYTDLFDNEIYPKTRTEDIVPWDQFTRDFESKDIEYDAHYQAICEANKDKLIDFRPYCINNPFVVMTTDFISKACELFRKMHLRQLIVVHPSNGSLCGVITRADLFRFLDL